MYGLINKAIKMLVCERYGEAQWERLYKAAGIANDLFISMEKYPDKLTYDLVAQAPNVFGIASDDFLKEIGEYWISYTGNGDYRDIFKLAGNNFVSFLENINTIHSRVAVIFPTLTPPIFQCVDVEANSLRLEYYSKRKGLSPMIFGLIKGLGHRFNTRVEVKQESLGAKDKDCDVFLIRFYPKTKETR